MKPNGGRYEIGRTSRQYITVRRKKEIKNYLHCKILCAALLLLVLPLVLVSPRLLGVTNVRFVSWSNAACNSRHATSPPNTRSKAKPSIVSLVILSNTYFTLPGQKTNWEHHNMFPLLSVPSLDGGTK
ncbi:hypothetical protein E2C01_034033 [Portunus trituberculatus]|uniref:Uncharacterized protein n=1 Tax=Portunus trituberculatus TaxID=210409 RepID=A0A5B7F4E2_PORTR|nr:hypothetical protein [Portunus trituberculatus]